MNYRIAFLTVLVTVLAGCAHFDGQGGPDTRAALDNRSDYAPSTRSPYIWTERMQGQFDQLSLYAYGTGIAVERTSDDRLKITTPSDSGFSVGRAQIKRPLRAILSRVADTLKEHTITTVQIVGHTDSSGSKASNHRLSLRRANATRDFLVKRGVASSRVSTAGRGEDEPIASNRTRSGRAQNRRVELYIAQVSRQ